MCLPVFMLVKFICYGKNAHSVGGADWREEMASALVQ